MPPRGLTQRTVARFARYYQDQVRVERYKGTLDEVEQWENLGTFNGRLVAKGGFFFKLDGQSQTYDAQVTILGAFNIDTANDRFRLKVVQWKSPNETLEDDGEEKRTRWLEPVSFGGSQDPVGTDIFLVMRCKNAAVGS